MVSNLVLELNKSVLCFFINIDLVIIVAKKSTYMGLKDKSLLLIDNK